MVKFHSSILRLVIGAAALHGGIAGYCNWYANAILTSLFTLIFIVSDFVFILPPFHRLTRFISWSDTNYLHHRGPLGTGASSTCNGDVQGGDWCNVNQYNCETGCGGRWCTNDGGGNPPSTNPPPGTKTATKTNNHL